MKFGNYKNIDVKNMKYDDITKKVKKSLEFIIQM